MARITPWRKFFPIEIDEKCGCQAYGAEQIGGLYQADKASPRGEDQLARSYVAQTQPRKRIRRTTPSNVLTANSELPGLVQRPG